MHKLRDEGVDAGFDIFHEEMGVSVITVILPSWYQAMNPAQRKKAMNKLKLWFLCHASSKLLGFGFDDIEMAYISNDYKQYEGKTVHQIAIERNKSDLDTTFIYAKRVTLKVE